MAIGVAPEPMACASDGSGGMNDASALTEPTPVSRNATSPNLRTLLHIVFTSRPHIRCSSGKLEHAVNNHFRNLRTHDGPPTFATSRPA